MNWIRRHPLFVGLMAACLAILFVEGWFVGERSRTARANEKRMHRAASTLRALWGTVPSLTASTTAGMNAELIAVSSELESLRSLIVPRARPADDGEKSSEPVERADGFFDIASFVERMRDYAQQQGVELKADERFGFGDYAHTGPSPTDVSLIFKERVAMESLLKALFDARPRQLIAVQRERRVATKTAPLAGEPMIATTVRADYFDWDQRASVRQAGSITTRALRISFVSQTVSLRTLLNGLAEAESTLVVRGVEVAPMTLAGGGANNRDVELERPRPLVPQSYSRFTVTVELIESADEAFAGG